MTPIQNFSEALHFLCSAGVLWVLFFRLARSYRIDALRDRLFAVREELFDYAAAGRLAFNDPAYLKLRMLINSLIRFAHRLTFTRFLMGLMFRSIKKQPCDLEPLMAWEQAVNALPLEQREHLKHIHNECILLIVWHLVTGSPIMQLLLALFSIQAMLNGLAKRVLEGFASQLPGLDSLQMQAIEADHEERHPAEVMAY